ncbi:MAG: rhomboid family intramembrane serine protease [Candidatus Melainabacteria bacterium]|nr:rhomboid family intramembrane serine protease [Candidatus Melainabacteria bacterium]
MHHIGTLSPAAAPRDYSKVVIRAEVRHPVVTLALVIVNIAIWAIMSGPSEQDARALVNDYAFFPERMWQSIANQDYSAITAEALRSVSSLFVHERDYLHVAPNMLLLFLFGRSVERRLGRLRFGILYLLSGALSCAAYGAIVHDGGASFGASSAVCGVLGAFVVLFIRRRPFVSMLPLAVLGLNMYCAVNITAAGFTFFAHLIGSTIGFLCACCMIVQLTPQATTVRAGARG